MKLVAALAGALLFSSALFGQGGGRGAPLARIAPSDKAFDPHDLSGIWTRNGTPGGYGGGGTCADCGDRGFGNDVPPFTPLGQKLFDANKPSYGRLLGSPDAAAHSEEAIGRRRAVPPANGTDPYQYCNPEGVTRALIYPDPVEFIQLPDRIYQHFEWGYGIRTIWLDGRKLADDPDFLRWWGFSTSHWEGNVLVVESNGFDPRTWVDHFGYPHTDQMRLQERYHRTNYNTVELSMTITDPQVYTKPWVSQTKKFHLLPKDGIKTVDGWTGLLEDVCAPADEVDQFDKRVRDPAGGVTHK
ncbi:MAG TPA: hypothetical protein VK776_26340 [Bryobacteraceae bacterium]|nr:hypothetical protein [Bryobacteraceae bacterium]